MAIVKSLEPVLPEVTDEELLQVSGGYLILSHLLDGCTSGGDGGATATATGTNTSTQCDADSDSDGGCPDV
jgi:hypothetical protein